MHLFFTPSVLSNLSNLLCFQYMSAIFYHSPEQKALAERTLKEEASRQTRNITTKILPAGDFTDAEE